MQVEWAPDTDGDFQMLRLAWLPEGGTALVGPMCCSPERAGFRAEFRDFSVGLASVADVHS